MERRPVVYYLLAFGRFENGASPESVRDKLLSYVQGDVAASRFLTGEGWAAAELETPGGSPGAIGVQVHLGEAAQGWIAELDPSGEVVPPGTNGQVELSLSGETDPLVLDVLVVALRQEWPVVFWDEMDGFDIEVT